MIVVLGELYKEKIEAPVMVWQVLLVYIFSLFKINKNVGGYPSRNHRMATCCTAMYSLMGSRDEIITSPPKGKGASLKIRYYL
jgi:hypothetical protein